MTDQNGAGKVISFLEHLRLAPKNSIINSSTESNDRMDTRSIIFLWSCLALSKLHCHSLSDHFIAVITNALNTPVSFPLEVMTVGFECARSHGLFCSIRYCCGGSESRETTSGGGTRCKCSCAFTIVMSDFTKVTVVTCTSKGMTVGALRLQSTTVQLHLSGKNDSTGCCFGHSKV